MFSFIDFFDNDELEFINTNSSETYSDYDKLFDEIKQENIDEITFWDIKGIKIFNKLFSGNKEFDNLLLWNTKTVEYMIETFSYSIYNKPLYWITDNLLDTSYMFMGNLYFNYPLKWNTPKLYNATMMFCFSKNYNQKTYFNEPKNPWSTRSVFICCNIDVKNYPKWYNI
mgnify:CR=1 FL=1